MDSLRRTDIRRLLGVQEGLAISLYLPEVSANSRMLEDLARGVAHQLDHSGISRSAACELMGPLRQASESIRSLPKDAGGLAVFRSRDLILWRAVPIPVPVLAAVGTRFELSPLHPAIETGRHFALIRIAEDSVKLLGLFPGHWPTSEIPNKDQLVPALLAGPAARCSAFRASHPNAALFSLELHSEDDVSDTVIEARACDLIRVYRDEVQHEAADEYHQLWHSQRASNHLPVVTDAAAQGRVKAVFVARDHLQQVLALSDAMFETFLHGGQVFPVPHSEVPGRGTVAAIFHY